MAKKDIAQPIEFSTTKYMKRPKWGRYAPFGYEDDPDDPKMWRPIHAEIDALMLAFKYLKASTFEDVARWLVDVTGREFTSEALRRLVEKERRRQNSAKQLRSYAARAREYREGLTEAEIHDAEAKAAKAESDITAFKAEGPAELPDVRGITAARSNRIRGAVLRKTKPEKAEYKQAQRIRRYKSLGLEPWEWDCWPTSCFPA
jgi:hypothetical protein